MKTRIFATAFAALFALAANAQSLEYAENYRQAVQGAMDDARAAIAASAIPAGAPVAILPIDGDPDGWLAAQLKIALTAAGRTCVEGKEDPMWGEILKEIEWDERKADILDAATVDKFGKLKSARVLLYAFVRSVARNERYAFFEIELHATSIETKQHIWGGIFAKRHYMPGFEDAGRVTDIPAALRDAMQKKLTDAIVASVAAAPRLAGVKTVAFIPLTADYKDYAMSLTRDALSRTKLTAVNLDLATIAEARMQLRDIPGSADALLFGSLRDLSKNLVETTPNSKTYEYMAELQLVIESASHETLWSDTFTVTERTTDTLGWWDTLVKFFPSLKDHPLRAITVPLGILIGLIILIWFLRATTRVR